MKNIIVMMVVLMFLTNCNSKVDIYKDKTPKVDIKEYFNGPVKAWGIVQDWKGDVIKQFDAELVGKWDGDEGTLDEIFTYYDGTEQKRLWKIKKLSENEYEGTASDILGKATGKQSGNAVNWHYVMDLPVDDTTYKIKFDDWMWQMNDGVLINRSYMKKFGITVGELTIFMKKQ